MIYLDNAATTYPKPACMLDAVSDFVENVGASPGRSGHQLALKASHLTYEAREELAGLFNFSNPLGVVFTHNITEAMNLAQKGLLRAGDHVITSSMEHNAVMRPLRALADEGVDLTIVPCSPQGFLDPQDIERAIQKNTVLIVLNHASNVTGSLLPVAEVGRISRRHDLLYLVDSAQSAGAVHIDMQASNIDLLGFTGHKGLYGPTGTGGLLIGERVDLSRFHPLKRGGTGSRSEKEEQPDFLPDVFESGTQNIMGIAGLLASLRWLQETGIENIKAHESDLTGRLIRGLMAIPNVVVYGGRDAEKQTATVSFNIQGMPPSEAGLLLDEHWGILCRVGLHCAPAAHRTIGTFPNGTVRFGLGYMNSKQDVQQALAAVRELAGSI